MKRVVTNWGKPLRSCFRFINTFLSRFTVNVPGIYTQPEQLCFQTAWNNQKQQFP